MTKYVSIVKINLVLFWNV